MFDSDDFMATGVSYNHNRHPLAHKRQRGGEGELGRTLFGPMRCITNGKKQEARPKGVKFYPRAHAHAEEKREGRNFCSLGTPAKTNELPSNQTNQ